MTPSPVQPLEVTFSQAWPTREWSGSHAILAVSGGADSVAMLRAAIAIKQQCGGIGRLYVAHLNHGLRGDASAGDATWLETLCGRLNVPLEIGQADVHTIGDQQGDGKEAAARTARYGFLRDTAEKLGARFVAVAHTADDQVETVLHRILRGTGIDGLRGIPAVRRLSPSVTVVRPLLAARRREVVDYLAALGQDFRLDASNADLRWTRNRLRHELLPAIRRHGGADVDSALLRLVAQATETHDFIATIAAQLQSECVTLEFSPMPAPGHRHVCRMRVHCENLATQPPLIIRVVCKSAWQDAGWPRQAMGYHQWHQLALLVTSNRDSTLNLPYQVWGRREGGELILERRGLS